MGDNEFRSQLLGGGWGGGITSSLVNCWDEGNPHTNGFRTLAPASTDTSAASKFLHPPLANRKQQSYKAEIILQVKKEVKQQY